MLSTLQEKYNLLRVDYVIVDIVFLRPSIVLAIYIRGLSCWHRRKKNVHTINSIYVLGLSHKWWKKDDNTQRRINLRLAIVLWLWICKNTDFLANTRTYMNNRLVDIKHRHIFFKHLDVSTHLSQCNTWAAASTNTSFANKV